MLFTSKILSHRYTGFLPSQQEEGDHAEAGFCYFSCSFTMLQRKSGLNATNTLLGWAKQKLFYPGLEDFRNCEFRFCLWLFFKCILHIQSLGSDVHFLGSYHRLLWRALCTFRQGATLFCTPLHSLEYITKELLHNIVKMFTTNQGCTPPYSNVIK